MTEQKLKNKKWTLLYNPGTADLDKRIGDLQADMGISPIMARLLHNRGCRDAASVKRFLRQEDAVLHDPFLMCDMQLAVDRIHAALENKEKIAIYGDYDVDGVTSVSLLYLYLTARGGDVGYYIPSRTKEGYGLSKPAIDRLKERGVSLMITVDTGITANEETVYAKSIGIDTVITDHHECHAELPTACAVVNPHRPDDPYPFKELAGVGVVFKLICAYETWDCRQRGESVQEGIRRVCNDYADLVAIGTIADVMPVVDENRLIVSLGLQLLENTKRPGIRALMDEVSAGSKSRSPQKRKINSGYIGFVIAPRMNAAGRVSSASIAVEMLLATDEGTAQSYAKQLCELNTERQVEENRIAEQAYKKIEQTLDAENDCVIVIEDDAWKQGIIGIVSSRITERYGLPSILISFDGATRGFPCGDDMGKGSGRSVKGLNLVEALSDCNDLLVRFGGHELAAGLTVRRCMIDEFRRRINRYAAEHLSAEQLCVSVDVDCEVRMQDLTMRLAEEISMLEPFGISNPVPNFVLSKARICRVIPMGGGKHTKLIIEKDGLEMSAVWFNVNAAKIPFEPHECIDVLFQLNVNEFQNVTTLQMLVQDIRLSPEYEEDLAREKACYEELRHGAEFSEEENYIPSREDMACVYTILRHEFRNGRTVFSIRRILSMLRDHGAEHIGYVKLKFIIRIMQELQICGVTEPGEDRYVFDFYFHTSKTNIEKSSILRRLKSQMRRADA